MKRIIFAIVLALSIQGAFAQRQSNGTGSTNQAGLLYASNFAQWSVPQGDQGVFSWSSPSFCTVTSNGFTFAAFIAGVPIYIQDIGNPANSEKVTPTLVSITESGCSIAVAPTNSHTSFYLKSATYGLGEALAYAGTQPYEIVLTPDWQRLGGTTATITSLAGGNTSVSILDQRTSSPISYAWSGSAYNSGIGGAATFTVSGCGTSTTLEGGPLIGQFTGGSATCTPVVTTGIKAIHGYSCNIQDQTTATALFQQTASTSTTVTFTAQGTVGATDIINFYCGAF